MALLIGFCWGLFEGIWFFIIPDIALSFFALKGFKPALYATFAVIVGAMVAAISLFTLFQVYPETLETFRSIWSHLPGYYPSMFEVAKGHLQEAGTRGLLLGPSSGIPYRFYIYEAFKENLSLINFLIWTPAARLERIIIAPIACFALRLLAEKILIPKYNFSRKKTYASLHLLIILYWCAIYYWYWVLFLPKTYH